MVDIVKPANKIFPQKKNPLDDFKVRKQRKRKEKYQIKESKEREQREKVGKLKRWKMSFLEIKV